MFGKFLFGLLIVAVAAIGWTVGGRLSTDAVALLLGFGLCFVCVAVPLCVLTLYGRKQAVQVQIHVHEQKAQPRAPIVATGLITQQPAKRWRVLANSTSLAVRETEITVI